MMTLAITRNGRDSGKRGGKPYIAGTGGTVRHMAGLHKLGWPGKDLMEECE